MANSTSVSVVQQEVLRRSWKRLLVAIILLLIFLIGLVTIVVGGVAYWRFTRSGTPSFASDIDHFKYGSIGSEPTSGLPYWVWRALPGLFPEVFHGSDYSVFGFLYETDERGNKRDLPIGISRREVSGVELAWMNCAVCHTGTVRDTAQAAPRVIAAMPSNNLDLHRFIKFVLGMADDPRLEPDSLIPAVQKAGADLDWLDRLTWRYIVIPQVRQGLLERRVRLDPLLAYQPSWGPGRVDTFNPYKLIQFHMAWDSLTPQERVGTADFPSIFNQGPREGMHLHWDGNNTSLAERNLSAALGAGVTVQSVDHASIERVAHWLLNLHAPSNPYRPDSTKVTAGRAIYMSECAACHGYQDNAGYAFKGEQIGQVEPNAKLNADPGRLNSYTQRFRDMQLTLFSGTPYQFKYFTKTDGYADLPLDALWLRAPYLHNGSVPTLADLLLPPDQRPKSFVRGLDVLDQDKGGFQAPLCNPAQPPDKGFCFDTSQVGNGNGGHLYGTNLPPDQRAALLAYLLTF
jgi:mono/diheme cytochrome c family protein